MFNPDANDAAANAAYLDFKNGITDGSAVENVVVGCRGRGDIVLDFDASGRLLGVEVIGATKLLSAAALAAAERV